ncbi:amidohydrolase [Bhargavaea beijingensis]|uniref:Amidohydrolase n=2 Tax=Bhargavaea beijingensis TaxID=426756 RepID=A0A1G7FUG3_9BACL|nr:amidohydrolase [Bhargavaea beijingensis]
MMKDLKDKVLHTFQHFHAHPELSWEETETTKTVAGLLAETGCRVRTFEDCTGVIGDIGNFSDGNPIIALRADMDALYQEVQGEMRANHSCGHDAHMTMVLGTLWNLCKQPGLLEKIGVRFIFQPAEEVGTGALKLVEQGVVDDVDYYYGIHLRPHQETPDGKAAPAIVHGATGAIAFEIRGDDAHGARPHLTHNAVEIGTYLVNAFHTIHLDPNVPHTAKVTRFLAGGRNINIIPGNASIALDIRAQTNDAMEQLRTRILEMIQSARDLFHVEIKITDDFGIAAAEVHPEAEEVARQAIVRTIGENNLTEPIVTPGGDDFHFYTINRPHLKATMVGLGCGLAPGLHHPDMTFNPEAMMNGIEILSEIVAIHAERAK